MRTLKVAKDFTYFHRGTVRQDYAKGEEIETDDHEMADVAVSEGWAKEVGGKKLPADPLAEEIAALEAQIKAETNSDKAAELQAALDDKRAELAKR